MLLGDVSNDGQPQPRPAMSPAPPAVHPIEAVEHTLERIRRNTGPVVVDLEQRLRGFAVDPDGDSPWAVARVAQRVLHKVAHQLPQAVVVAMHHDRLRLERDSLTGR